MKIWSISVKLWYLGGGDVCAGRLCPKVNPKPFYIQVFMKKEFLSYTSYWQMVPLSHTFFRTLHLLALLEPFTDTNDRFCYPFIYFNKSLKSLPFHILETWKRYPSRAEPSCIGHHGEYPPPHPSGSDITGRVLKVTRPSFFGGVPSYFETLWFPHLYFYRKSNT